MKNLFLLLCLMTPAIVIAQWSVSAEYSVDPFYSLKSDGFENFEEDRSFIKELNLTANYELSNFFTLGAGVTRLDKKNASSFSVYIQDNFILGDVIQVQNLTLRHRSGIRSYSAFAGMQVDLGRLHFANNVHYALGTFTDPAIVGREYSSFTGATKETFYDINYKNINFIRVDLSVVYDLLKAKKGNISIVLKYAKDFTSEKMFTVSSYEPGLREMVENFPGSSYYDLDEFLEGGPLNYDREFWGVGLRMTYNLGTENSVDN